jgi:hypothetical protein
LGSFSAIIGFLILWGFRYFERRFALYQRAELKIKIQGDEFSSDELRERLRIADFRIKSLSVATCVREHERSFECQVGWPSPQGNADVPKLVSEIEHLPGVIKVEWKAWNFRPR